MGSKIYKGMIHNSKKKTHTPSYVSFFFKSNMLIGLAFPVHTDMHIQTRAEV